MFYLLLVLVLIRVITQPALTYSKLRIATVEQGAKYVQSQQKRHENDAFLLLTLNM